MFIVVPNLCTTFFVGHRVVKKGDADGKGLIENHLDSASQQLYAFLEKVQAVCYQSFCAWSK